MEIDRERLRDDIQANAAFGALDVDRGRGRTVRCGDDANRRAREYLVDRLVAAELAVRVDAVGNVAGRWTPASADPEAAPVASGSHLDSVPAGGIFDGPLGVYGGLEAVRAMQDTGIEPARPVEVVSFTEEEGSRFASGLLGSSVAAGVRPVDEALALTDEADVRLDDALEAIRFRGEGRLEAEAWDAWVELHVEQSRRLEEAGVPVGVVTDITGISHTEVTFRGEANHAGATPMDARTDAVAAAAEFVLDIEAAANRVVAEASETAVGTVGRTVVEPNATNVVPGRATLGLDVRDVTADGMAAILAAAEASLDRVEMERGVQTATERQLDVAPTSMSDRVQQAARAAGERADVATTELHSGAAHDSMHVASVTDAGMLFAPSRDGVSHSPLEWTEWADCAAATQVLAGALADLAGAS
jgi:N-carbamoyl-L-amino-acid hydrolase